MPDREKVKNGVLQCLIDYSAEEFNTQCYDCPYYYEGVTLAECKKELRNDFLAMLNEHENASKRNPVIVCPHCGKRLK